jgi:hypothetical protein
LLQAQALLLCWDEHHFKGKRYNLFSNSRYQTMNFLSLIQRQQQKKQALQVAQAAIAKTANLCYRGVCYTR